MRTRREHLRGQPRDAFLLCPECHCRFSANYADYWRMHASAVFACDGGGTHRKRHMRLAQQVTTIEFIR